MIRVVYINLRLPTCYIILANWENGCLFKPCFHVAFVKCHLWYLMMIYFLQPKTILLINQLLYFYPHFKYITKKKMLNKMTSNRRWHLFCFSDIKMLHRCITVCVVSSLKAFERCAGFVFTDGVWLSRWVRDLGWCDLTFWLVNNSVFNHLSLSCVVKV